MESYLLSEDSGQGSVEERRIQQRPSGKRFESSIFAFRMKLLKDVDVELSCALKLGQGIPARNARPSRV